MPPPLAGGTPRQVFEAAGAEVRRAVAMGVSGLVYGRYIFGHPQPEVAVARLLEALRSDPDGSDPDGS